jgi:hypothetical protein
VAKKFQTFFFQIKFGKKFFKKHGRCESPETLLLLLLFLICVTKFCTETKEKKGWTLPLIIVLGEL